jgi:hypothetical protein
MNNTITYTSQGAKLTFTRLESNKQPTFQIETNRAYSMSIPLGRHLRTLIELYGYEEIHRLVVGYPESLKGDNDETSMF